MRNILRKANFYLEMGWSFYPTRPLSKIPHARLLPIATKADGTRGPVWTPFQSQQPDAFDVEMWFKQEPEANLALVTGKVSNLVIIDMDTPEAVLAFLELCGAETIYDFGTPVVVSNRGWHLYFLRPDAERCSGDLGLDGCDVKADGGCCTAPPSVHQSGHLYRFELSPAKYELAPLPAPVIERLQERQKPKQVVSNFAYFPDKNLTKYLQATLSNTIQEIATCTSNRNDLLNAKAYSMGRLVGGGLIDEETVFEALKSAALRAGLTPSEINPTIISGLNEGRKYGRRPNSQQAQPSSLTQSAPRPTVAQLRAQRHFA